MAAAAAVATGKKRKRPHIFESNPSIRKRQQTRLLRYKHNNFFPHLQKHKCNLRLLRSLLAVRANVAHLGFRSEQRVMNDVFSGN